MTQQWNAEALRESLLWTASSLAALGKEQDVIVLEGRHRTVGEILDEANEALEVGTPPASAQDDAKDDSIALDKLADYIADTWPDKKYGLEEICQRLHAMWPGEFLSAADLEKNDPNVREALRALLLWWDRFQASDGDPKDACELLVKGARSAWKFAKVEIDRVPVPAPAAGDARDAERYRWLREQAQQHQGRAPVVVLCDESDLFQKGDAGSESGFVYGNRLDAAIDAARAASQQQEG